MVDDRHLLGAHGEALAAQWYERRGFVVLARNWRCSFGELDLVVSRPGLVVFCEVKTRSSTAYGGAVAAVSLSKQRRVRRLAAAWLASHPGRAEVRFDVAAVDDGVVGVVEGAF
ncbi:MAG TPA: YraN family protein [Acidimicrobiales bacterium]